MRSLNDRTLTISEKNIILEKYDYCCIYCFSKAETVDHIIPWSYLHDNREENLVACCWLCNVVAGSNVFKNFKLKKEYILTKRYNFIQHNPIPLWIKDELNSLSYILKIKIETLSIILDNEQQRQIVKERLLKEGFRVVT